MRGATRLRFSGTRIAGGLGVCTSTSVRRRCGASATNCDGGRSRHVVEPRRHDCRPQSVHPGRSPLLPSRPPADAEQLRLLRQSAPRALVGSQARARRPAWSLVSRGRSAATTVWSGGTSRRRFVQLIKVCTVNLTGSRMREIRTYGLMRGCWPVRHRTAGWGLLHLPCRSATRRRRHGQSSLLPARFRTHARRVSPSRPRSVNPPAGQTRRRASIASRGLRAFEP